MTKNVSTTTCLPKTEVLEDEQANLWAMSYGFGDTDEMKEWGEQMERDRLAEIAFKKGGEQ